MKKSNILTLEKMEAGWHLCWKYDWNDELIIKVVDD